MSYTRKNCSLNEFGQPQFEVQSMAFDYVHNLSAEKLKETFLSIHESSKPIEELIATGEAVFALIRNSEMELGAKNAFHQLEKQFEFYRNPVMH